ncbi:hypothetical protein AURDEDRAFT_113261 [Auricularia subglabra TFB-10046 SS5]|nr:hypothetical protein AURDEDRAFT_113261 [Auricularia subglabra TFB-10046 SS5]
MSDSNRAEGQAEMKKVISDSFTTGTLWSTDWNNVKLQTLQPKPLSFSLKRKMNDTPVATHTNNKKAKKNKQMAAPAFDTEAEQLAKARRAQRFEREHEIERQRANGSYSSLADRVNSLSFTPTHVKKNAAKRNMYGSFNGDDNGDGDSRPMDWERFRIVGRSQDTFKHYLRLTSEPDPATIRPIHVLKKTLAELKLIWRRDNNYPWICDQFKSLRQDLTVQGIKDEFAVAVYEIHARMALESNDLVEFNSCIATLTHLYEQGLPGKTEEFLAYRILYLVHAKNRSEMNRLIGQLTPEQKAAEPVRHALQVQRAVASGNYHALFVLFNQAPNMGGYIMDHFVIRERVQALIRMGVAYKTMPLEFLTSELGFENAEDAHKFLSEHNAALYTTATHVALHERSFDCKNAHPVLKAEFEAKYRKVGIKGSV